MYGVLHEFTLRNVNGIPVQDIKTVESHWIITVYLAS